MDIDTSISAVTTTRINENIDLNLSRCQTLVDAIRCILQSGFLLANNITMTVDQEDAFEIIEQLQQHPKKMFMYLCKHFAKYFDIDLYLIVFDNGKYSLMNQYTFEKNRVAFIQFNEDNSICGPLYKTNTDGTMRMVFRNDFDSLSIEPHIYVAFLNTNQPTSGVPQVQEQQAVSCIQEFIENSSFDNFIHLNYDQTNEKHQCCMMINQTLQVISHLFEKLSLDQSMVSTFLQPFICDAEKFQNLSSDESITAASIGIQSLSKMVQIIQESFLLTENISGDINGQSAQEQHQQSSTESTRDASLQSSSEFIMDNSNLNDETSNHLTVHYNEAPSLVKPLKGESHPRTLAEFARGGSCPVQCINSGQRDPIQIKVVPPDDNLTLYLSMGVVNIKNRSHPGKIFVCDKTKATDETLRNLNDLKCLDFTECEDSFFFDYETKHLHSIISSNERRNHLKEVRIHAINLYQRGRVKSLLKKCPEKKKYKLALWYSVFKNKRFHPVSPVSYSDVVQETMRPADTTSKATVKRKNESTYQKSNKKR